MGFSFLGAQVCAERAPGDVHQHASGASPPLHCSPHQHSPRLLHQGFVSLRRIEKYLGTREVSPAPPLDGAHHPIVFQSATVTWPQDRSSSSSSSSSAYGPASGYGSASGSVSGYGSASSSAAPTPRRKFTLIDLTLNFPPGELSLICGKLGSGKTLLLLCECRVSTPSFFAHARQLLIK